MAAKYVRDTFVTNCAVYSTQYGQADFTEFYHYNENLHKNIMTFLLLYQNVMIALFKVTTIVKITNIDALRPSDKTHASVI